MADEIPAWASDEYDPTAREAVERLRAAEGRDPFEERSFEKIDYPRPAPDPYEERPKPAAPSSNPVVDRALRLTSDQFQSNARPVVENGKINWGDQELGGSAADFFRADAARMAMEKAASDPQARAQLERSSGSTGSGRVMAYAPVPDSGDEPPILRAIRGAESSNNPFAKNPRSSASGLFQFTDGTWGSVLRRMDPATFGGYKNQQLASLKTNPDQQALQKQAAKFHFENDILPTLRRAGIEATPGNIYLSWFQGPQGAVRAYRAPPSAKVFEVFPETVSANANMRFRGKPYAQWTMDDLREFTATAMSRRMRADGGQVGSGSVDDQSIGWSPERIERELNWSHYDDGRAKAHVAFVNPSEFLHSTTKTEASAKDIASAAGDLDDDKLLQSSQSPFLKVRDGKIVDHEGRHRMAALAAAGHKRVPVMVWHDQAKKLTPIDRINLKAQHEGRPGLSVFDAVPLHRSYKSQIENIMGGADKRFAGGGSVDPGPQYHLDTHKQLHFIAQTERRFAPGAANYYHRTITKNLHPDLEKYYAEKVAPLLEKAGYPKVGSPKHHEVIKEIVSNWRDEDLDDAVRDTDKPSKAEGGSVDDQPQRDLSPLGLYSHAAEMASQLPQERGSPQQMAGMLTNNKYQVKPVEMEGFDEAFANQPVVTRDQLVQHFKSKMPQIEETIFGGKKAPEMDHAAKGQWIERYAAQSAYNSGDIENVRDWREASPEVLDWHRDIAQNKFDELMALDPDFADRFQSEGEGGKTKFQQYTLPGGENYREVLLKLPEGYNAPKEALDDLAAARQRFKELEKRHNDELEAGLTGEMNMSYEDFSKLTQERDIAKARVKNFEKIVNQPAFQSSHWQEPDVLAHLRMSDRTGPNGEKILHVEEIQSDWGQKGREEGFAKKLDPKILDQLGEEQSSAMFRLEDAREAFNNAYENIFKENLKSAFKDAPTEYDLQNALKMHDEVIKSNHPQKRFDEYKSNFLRMPDSFTPEQHSLLQDAYDAHLEARDAYNDAKDKMAEYRSSSKGVPVGPYVTKTADWTDFALKRALKEAVDGGYDKLVWTPGEEQAKRYSLSTKVERIAYDPEEKVFSYVPKGRHDWIDHDKTVEPKDLPGIVGKEVAEKLLATEPSKLNGIHNLEAADLEVGGHGMKGYYDKIVPTQLQKLVKKLDPEARFGKYKLPESENPVHSLEITPKMREAVKRGLPAFASGGAVDEDEDEGITAYHGSPYDFPKFDISKIGTGEGNATYGHGLYFAGNEDVAKGYRDDLSARGQSPKLRVGDKEYNVKVGGDRTPQEELLYRLFQAAQENRVDFGRGIDPSYGDETIETAMSGFKAPNEVRNWAKKELMGSKHIDLANAGHMYEVRIKAHPDHFLDWDEVLEDQNDYIKNLLPRIADRDRKEKGWSDLDDHLQEPDAYTGGAFYRSLAQRGREKEASEILSQMGIKGIRYKDAASRFKNGEPSYNYVVFNHDHVDIKRKYARGGAVDVG